MFHNCMKKCCAPDHLEPGREVASHDDDRVLELSVNLGRQLGVGKLSHRHKYPERIANETKINGCLRKKFLLVSFHTRI